MEKEKLARQKNTPRNLKEHILIAKLGLLPWQDLQKVYLTIFKDIKFLYKAHGGRSNFFTSPYVHLSIILALCATMWKKENWDWSSTAIAVLPSIIGLSLTAYALILSFGSDSFRDVIRGKIEEEKQQYSPYLQLSISFAYFLSIQVFSLLVSIMCQSLNVNCSLFNFLGLTLFFYAISLPMAAILTAFALSKQYDSFPK